MSGSFQYKAAKMFAAKFFPAQINSQFDVIPLFDLSKFDERILKELDPVLTLILTIYIYRRAKSLHHSRRFFTPDEDQSCTKQIETVVKIKVSGSTSKEFSHQKIINLLD